MPRKTKNPAPVVKVTYCDLLTSTMLYKIDSKYKYEAEIEQARALNADTLAAGLQEHVERLEAEIELLRVMYKTETGTEYGL